MKKINQIMGIALVLIMLFGQVSMAGANITARLSDYNGKSGERIAVVGTTEANQFVSVKILDDQGSIVYYNVVVSGVNGDFSCNWLVPDVEPGDLDVIVGYDTNVVQLVFEVEKSDSGSGNNNNNNNNTINNGNNGTQFLEDDEDDEEDDEERTIKNGNGETLNGKFVISEGRVSIEIEGDDFRALGDSKDKALKIHVNGQVVELDEKIVEHLLNKEGDFKLSIEQLDENDLPAAIRGKVGERPIFDFNLSIGGIKVSDLGGKATISVPYDLGFGENPNAIVVYYIDEQGALIPVRGRYNKKTGEVDFVVDHFSVYAVGYNEVTFDDVSEGDWYKDAVDFCGARGISNGTSLDLFSPEVSLTRGQFIVMLMRAYGIEVDSSQSDNFADAGQTYYTPYLATAKALEISNGIGNNLFAPEEEITRQDMVTLLYRALVMLNEVPAVDGVAVLEDYSDRGLISDYAEEGMACMTGAGIISGNQGKLDPKGLSSRGQMAQVLMNLLSQ